MRHFTLETNETFSCQTVQLPTGNVFARINFTDHHTSTCPFSVIDKSDRRHYTSLSHTWLITNI